MSVFKRLSSKLHAKYAIIQAPMAGGPTTPALVAAVSKSGALGTLAAGYLSPQKLRTEIQEIRKLTNAPFAVNLFTPNNPTPVPDAHQLERSNKFLNPYRQELGLPLDPPLPSTFCEDLTAQLEAVLDERPAVFSFTFGIPPLSFLGECKKRGIITVGTATHLSEALVLQSADVDIICAQGIEAGGHRGTFIGETDEGHIGLLALVQQIVKDVGVPVIAAGGIMDGKGIASCLAMGASGVSLGTAFLLCPEAGTSVPYRAALLSRGAGCTELTRAFSGREARGIRNRFLTEMKKYQFEVPAYPIQNALTREIRQTAAKANKPEFLSLFAGQGATLIRQLPARQLVETLVLETVLSLNSMREFSDVVI